MKNWEEKLTEWSRKYNAEVLWTNREQTEGVIIYPRRPSNDSMKEIVGIIPQNVLFKYKELPKRITIEKLGAIATSAKLIIKQSSMEMTRNPSFQFSSVIDLENHPTLWKIMDETLELDGYFDSWTVSLNGKDIINRNPALEKEIAINQERDVPILKDDILNLRISLDSVETIEGLLAVL